MVTFPQGENTTRCGRCGSKATDLVMVRLRIAMWDRSRQGHPVKPGDLVCRSDAGRQHTSLRWTERLDLEGISPSIGTVGERMTTA